MHVAHRALVLPHLESRKRLNTCPRSQVASTKHSPARARTFAHKHVHQGARPNAQQVCIRTEGRRFLIMLSNSRSSRVFGSRFGAAAGRPIALRVFLPFSVSGGRRALAAFLWEKDIFFSSKKKLELKPLVLPPSRNRNAAEGSRGECSGGDRGSSVPAHACVLSFLRGPVGSGPGTPSAGRRASGVAACDCIDRRSRSCVRAPP